MVSNPTRAAFVALLVAVAPLGAQPAADDGLPPPIDRLVIFGDSLSDPGNAFLATRQFEVRPFDPIPAAPYLIGRLHFSNGPTWVERLASALRLRRSGKPALLRAGVYTNYAFGSARARPLAEQPFDLGDQVERFLADFDDVAAPETLCVLWIGANDLRDAVAALEEDPSGMTTADVIEAAIGATALAIQDLHAAGARSFLVLNLPNIGAAPALRVLGPDAQAAGEFFTEQYNDGLEAALEGLRDLLADSVIVGFDVFAGLEELVDHPDLAGLTNVTDSCITPGVIIGAICRQPDRFLFWDFIHPTAAAHEYLSGQVQATLELALHIWEPAS